MVMSTTEAANKKVIRRAISSPSQRRDRNERELAMRPAPGTVVVVVATLLNVGQSLLFLCNDLLGEPRIGKCFDVILPVRKHPEHEAFNGVALGSIRELRGDKQPGKTGNGIGILAWRIGDRDAEIVGHCFGGASSRCRDAAE